MRWLIVGGLCGLVVAICYTAKRMTDEPRKPHPLYSPCEPALDPRKWPNYPRGNYEN
jgi:hypothetical protein